jgi:hypothetical protein
MTVLTAKHIPGVTTAPNTLSYTSDGADITITGSGVMSVTHLIIPSLIEGLPVTKIGDAAFYNSNIYDAIVTLNTNQVKTIGVQAFKYWDKLTSVVMPEVVTIGYQGFYNNRELISVNMPKVETIGEGAFMSNILLQQVTMPYGVLYSLQTHGDKFYTTVLGPQRTFLTTVNRVARPIVDSVALHTLSLSPTVLDGVKADILGVAPGNAETAVVAVKAAIARVTNGRSNVATMGSSIEDKKEKRARRAVFSSIMKSVITKMGTDFEMEGVGDLMKKSFNIADGVTIGKVRVIKPPDTSITNVDVDVPTEPFTLYCPIEGGQSITVNVQDSGVKYVIKQYTTGQLGPPYVAPDNVFSLYSVSQCDRLATPLMKLGTATGNDLYQSMSTLAKENVITTGTLATQLFSQDDVFTTTELTTIFFGSVGSVGNASASGYGDPYITSFLA